jgi:hypothetical protein
MNLFRSEEHVKNWSYYDPISEESIMPMAVWAEIFGGPAHRNRLAPDILARNKEYVPAFFALFANYGKTGPFLDP